MKEKGHMTYTCRIETPLGTMTAAGEDGFITGLWFDGQRHFPARTEQWLVAPDHDVFAALRIELARYFSGKPPAGTLRLAPQGSPFQMAVWDALLRIPYGATTTYGALAKEIATRLGVPSMSAQAVGGAVGRNPISILIPCHRVVAVNGALTGYAGGVERKENLLRLEAAGLSGIHYTT